MNPSPVVLVGLGTRGRHWARVIAEDPRAQLLAGVDPDDGAVDTLRRALPAVDVPVMPLSGALDRGPALVVLSTPPALHLAQITACAERGIPVLCEKPLALDAATARACVDVAAQAGILLGVGMNFRYLETTRMTREYVQGGRLGRLGAARIVYWRYRDGRRPLLNKYPLSMEQPMLLEQSIHHLDLARYVYGSEVRRVWARTTNPAWSMYRSDATVGAWLEFDNGLELQYFGTWAGTEGLNEFQWRTDGEAGMLMQREMFRHLEHWPAGAAAPELLPLAEQEDFVDDTRGLFADFLAAVRGEPSGYPTASDHLKTMALTLACAESSRRGQAIDLAPFTQDLGLGGA